MTSIIASYYSVARFHQQNILDILRSKSEQHNHIKINSYRYTQAQTHPSLIHLIQQSDFWRLTITRWYADTLRSASTLHVQIFITFIVWQINKIGIHVMDAFKDFLFRSASFSFYSFSFVQLRSAHSVAFVILFCWHQSVIQFEVVTNTNHIISTHLIFPHLIDFVQSYFSYQSSCETAEISV